LPNLDQRFWIGTGNVVQENVIRGSGRADLLLSAPAGDHNCFSDNDFRSSLPPAIQTIHGWGFNLNRLGGGDLSGAVQTLGLFIRAESGKWPRGDWHTTPAPPPQPSFPACGPGAVCPVLYLHGPDLAVPGTSVPGVSRVRSATLPSIRPHRHQEVTVMGVSIAAPTWWSLMLATYAYLLPLILYVAWVSIAMWDLIRQDGVASGRRIGWMAVVLVVPLLGPILYYVLGRSPIPRSLRSMLVAGGMGIYILIAVLAIAVGGS
jgi:phospholipase D-like protein